MRLGVLIPLQNDFPAGDLDPDLNRVRPGRASLDQFGWIPGMALVSFSGGYFGDNRYGFSAGAARPLHDGDWLVDFNNAYNPACATSPYYNCPIPSKANTLKIAIRAGEKDSHYSH